ncbi:tripartite tricarboxylate transporter substrate binding protein [Bordetella sp. BOR01]|uniref:Bug family tripartite tricarboxylate transporter substrate binding protein n=1 Tax=Bordetella sp. BOR01 TaxID=2854779 RepID=UPI001C46C40F|nr:tripartite tricarboxylate transporter substrate binding protein [Bordetella sp. BOR01]MBV7483003.1 tripartite tricarboxylate transporter substrate binding protein [Bordetella sp. BOR01]
MHRYVSRIARCALALSCFAAVASHAQTYPDRPIKLVVPFPPGGGSDAVGRLIAKTLSDDLGQQVVVDNRGGAGGSIGTGSVARAAPDGYTLVLASTSEIAINPSLYPSLGYSTIDDLTPVAMVATTPMAIAVNPNVKAKTLQELAALVKRQPGKINVASAGTGTITHLSGEMYRAMNQLNWVHVPYKGTAPALADLVSGQVQIMFVPPPPVLGLAQSGRVRLVAVSGKTRAASMPEVPTVTESGTPGYAVDNWYGVFAPHGTPMAIVDKLAAAVAQGLRQKDVIDALAMQGAAPATLTRPQFTDYVKSEAAKWGEVVRSSSAKVE